MTWETRFLVLFLYAAALVAIWKSEPFFTCTLGALGVLVLRSER